MQQVFSSIFELIKSLGLPGAFLSMLIENLGVPFPIEFGYLIAQNLVSRGTVSYIVALAYLTAGHTFGSLISYLIGRWGDRLVRDRLKHNAKIAATQKVLQNWYDRYGNVTVFATRFVGYVRPWSSYVAGFARVPLSSFLVWTFAGSLLFNIAALFLADKIYFVWDSYPNFHFLIVLVGVVLFSALGIYGLFVKKHRKEK